MGTNLRPAHEVILEEIVSIHATILEFIKEGEGVFDSGFIMSGTVVFCAFLETLQKSIIPDDGLVKIIRKLKNIQSNEEFWHLVLDTAIINLELRLLGKR